MHVLSRPLTDQSTYCLMGLKHLQDGDALRAEVDVLRRRLAEKDAQVLTGEERLSRLEAVHRVAQVGFGCMSAEWCRAAPVDAQGRAGWCSGVMHMAARCIPRLSWGSGSPIDTVMIAAWGLHAALAHMCLPATVETVCHVSPCSTQPCAVKLSWKALSAAWRS